MSVERQIRPGVRGSSQGKRPTLNTTQEAGQ
ncbi:hypothetical protein STENM223S_03822 [Streptomyces tendae]